MIAHLLLSVSMLLTGCVKEMPDMAHAPSVDQKSGFHIVSRDMDMTMACCSTKIKFKGSVKKCDECASVTKVLVSEKWNTDLVLGRGTCLCTMGE